MSYSLMDRLMLSADVALLGVTYTLLGIFISFIFHYVFDEFDDAWKAKSIYFQLYDIVVELAIIVLCSFWLARYFRNLPLSVFPARFSVEIGTHAFDFFFMLSLFVFLDELVEKLRYLQAEFFSEYFDAIFPRYGSILDMSLSYTRPGKKEKDERE